MAEADVGTRPRRRRGFGRTFAEIHYRLRTEGDTPGRKAMAIALGTLIGCIPLYGTHAALCALFAGLFRLNRLVTYLGAHINNPFTAPFLLAISFKLGHRVQYGVWPSLHPLRLADIGFWNVGWDLLLGGFLIGLILAPAAGLAAWALSDRGRRPERWSRVIEEAARPYLETGVRHWEFVRGKLRHDPLYFMLHERLESRRGGTVLDFGCGVGIVLSLLDAQERIGGAQDASPRRELLGVDRNDTAVRVARAALDGRARIETGDLATFDPPEADVVLLLDVLHYLDAAAQVRILAAACRRLRPGGLLFLREPDAARRGPFMATRAAERLMAILRGHLRQKFHYRSGEEWVSLVRGCGLEVTVTDASRGTPFANVLIEGRSVQAVRSVGRASISE